MLSRLFISVLNMSLTASFAIAFVLIARLLLKKAPKLFSYTLWSIVLFRLLCPFSFESAMSLLPAKTSITPQTVLYAQTPTVDVGIPAINSAINGVLPAAHLGDSVNPMQIIVYLCAIVWVLGILAMLLYSMVSFVQLKKNLVGASPLKENIYLADHLSSPFVMGLFRPKIYLPSSLTDSEKDFITAHELCHLRRLDHMTRILGFVALAIHWFNPLAWIAFTLSGKDMERSCDEAVMKTMPTDIRTEYSQSLLRFGTAKRMIHATPLAFGESDTKRRVKNVLNYKRPKVWVVALALVAVVAVGIGIGTNQKTDHTFPMDGKSLSDLNSDHITQTIGKMVQTDFTELYLTPDNFGLVVSSDFDFVKSEAIRFLYDMKDEGCKASQLRIYHEEQEFFVTKSQDWVTPKEQVFKLYSFLEALKYLPKDEIYALCETPPHRFMIDLSENNRKYNEGRQIYYDKNGVTEESGWQIRLDISPMYGTDSTVFHGVGDDVIHLYYSD